MTEPQDRGRRQIAEECAENVQLANEMTATFPELYDQSRKRKVKHAADLIEAAIVKALEQRKEAP